MKRVLLPKDFLNSSTLPIHVAFISSTKTILFHHIIFLKTPLKGKGDFYILAQSFDWPQTKTSFWGQFSPKSPKVQSSTLPIHVAFISSTKTTLFHHITFFEPILRKEKLIHSKMHKICILYLAVSSAICMQLLPSAGNGQYYVLSHV